MADIAIFRINYKSDFIITLESDAGWSTPFCIKFWTDSPARNYFVGWDGKEFINCKVDETDASKLIVLFDDHHLPVGQLKMQMAWHTTIADFPYARLDEVMNQMDVVATIEGEEKHVELAFEGETAPEIAFSLPAYANEAQRIANEEQRIANETQRITNEEQRIAAEQTRQQNEQQRISNEEARVTEFARLKRESEQATEDANEAAVLATTAADLASAKAQLAQDAATLANQKAQLAADKAALADSAATLATAKAQLAQEKATYAQTQGSYAKAQGDYAKAQGDTAQADHVRAEADHTTAADDHSRAEADHETAVQDNAQMTELVERADADHVQAASDHTRADSDHATAAADHTQAGTDHTTATSDHEQATTDHTRAESDHTTASADHQQAVQDHETLAPTVAEHTQQIEALGTSKQDVITNLATIAMGSGVSHDDTYSDIRTSTIANFILLTNAKVDILFTTPINAADATLNVSLTGAKPIRILGQNLPAGVIKAETYATLAYDGTAWNIVNLFCPDAQFDPASLLVDMGLPSGVKWASRDIDLTKPGGFCETPFTYMKSFFSWGNIDGHNPSSVLAFDYDWGGVNQAEPWYDGQPYGSTPGNTLTGNIAVGEDFDAARANLGAPWRMPTNAEFSELFANIRYINADGTEVDTTKTDKLVTVNGVVGLYLESTINGARLFFSCSGNGYSRSWVNRGTRGYYWSSTWYSARYARQLFFLNGGVYPQRNDGRYLGFALRPVQ